MLPVMRDPDGFIYYKEEVGGLLMGGFEPKAKPWRVDPIPSTFQFQLLDEDWDQFEPLMTAAHPPHALPRDGAREDAAQRPRELHARRQLHPRRGARSCAASSSPPASTRPASPTRGGAGRLIAEWIVAGAAAERPRRRRHPPLRPAHRQQEGARRAHRRDARPALRDALAAPGARDGAAAAHQPAARPARRRGARCSAPRTAGSAPTTSTPPARERPGERREPVWNRTLGRPAWLADVVREQRATREAVALYDQTSFGKLLLQGRDALAVLQRLCANEMDVAPGRMVYTPMLNERGGYRERRHRHAPRRPTASWSSPARRRRRATSTGSSATLGAERSARCVTDVSGMTSVLSLMGPNARALLGRVGAPDDLRGARARALRFSATREIDLGFARVRAARMSYVGGPGFELYVPVEMARHVWLALHEASEGLGVEAGGLARRRLLRARRAAHRGRPARLGRRARRPTRRRSRPARASPSSSPRPTASSAATRSPRAAVGSRCASGW